MELLKAFEEFNYPNEIGPGVYDIHSPNIPSKEWIEGLKDPKPGNHWDGAEDPFKDLEI